MLIPLNGTGIVRHRHEVDVAQLVNPGRFRALFSKLQEGVEEAVDLISRDEVAEELRKDGRVFDRHASSLGGTGLDEYEINKTGRI